MAKSNLALLLTPAQRQALKDLAHAHGVREQVIARNAVLAAIAPGGAHALLTSDTATLISSVSGISKKLAALAEELSALAAKYQETRRHENLADLLAEADEALRRDDAEQEADSDTSQDRPA